MDCNFEIGEGSRIDKGKDFYGCTGSCGHRQPQEGFPRLLVVSTIAWRSEEGST